MRKFFIAAICILATMPALAAEPSITVDLADDRVNITTGFNGARLDVFGVKEQPGDIAVVITGPERRMVVRRKDQVMGLWMNNDSAEFRSVPSYYDYALSTQEKSLASPATLRKLGIGLDALELRPSFDYDSDILPAFQEALVRNKQLQGLFPLEPKGIVFLNDHFFRTTFHLPPSVPRGEYTVRTMLLRDGQVRDSRTTSVKVAQVGFAAEIFYFARAQSLAYGLVAVALAVLFGWAANTFLRRD